MGSTRRNYLLGMFLETLEMERGRRKWTKIQIWSKKSIVGAIQQLGDARQVGGNVQILLNVIDGRNRRRAKVARQGNEVLQRCGDVSDR